MQTGGCILQMMVPGVQCEMNAICITTVLVFTIRSGFVYDHSIHMNQKRRDFQLSAMAQGLAAKGFALTNSGALGHLQKHFWIFF